MVDIPDISSMSPDRWLSKMQQVREELLEEFDRVFAAATDSDEAVELLEEMLAEYTVKSETGESKKLLGVHEEEGAVVFRHESGDATFEVVADEAEFWYAADGEGPPEEPDDPSAHRRELAVRALELIPWWTEGAFSRRVGQPRDFID